MAPHVVGLDPSLTATGIAWADETFSVSGSSGDQRLTDIHHAVLDICDGAALAVVEDLPVHGHGAGKTGMAQGVVRLALLDLCVPYVLVTPAVVKKFATGRGSATKADMRLELFKRTGLDLRDDNECDAWWLRALGMAHLGYPIVELPADRAEMLTRVTWPAVAA